MPDTRYRVNCRQCHESGKHRPACELIYVTPVLLYVDEAGLIVEACLDDDTLLKNLTTGERNNTFMHPRLATFTEPRLVELEPIGHTAYFEECAAPVFTPDEASTPHHIGFTFGAAGGPPARKRRLMFNESISPAQPHGDYFNETNRINGRNRARAEMLKSIPTFNGEPNSFTAWRRRLEHISAQSGEDDETLLQVAISKLGNIPHISLQNLHECRSLHQLLEILGKEFDDLSTPSFASQQFSSLRQGTKPLREFHPRVYTILHGMNESPTTEQHLTISTYVRSLTSVSMRAKLNEKVISGKLKTLADVMEKAVMIEKQEKMTLHDGSTHATAAHAQTSDSFAAHSSPRPNNIPGAWCPIHNSTTHDLSQCRAREHTTCNLCRETVAPGTLAAHITKGECSAPKCHACSTPGHRSRFCRCPKGKATPMPRPPRQDGQQHRGWAPRRPQGQNQQNPTGQHTARARAATAETADTSDASTQNDEAAGNTSNETAGSA